MWYCYLRNVWMKISYWEPRWKFRFCILKASYQHPRSRHCRLQFSSDLGRSKPRPSAPMSIYILQECNNYINHFFTCNVGVSRVNRQLVRKRVRILAMGNHVEEYHSFWEVLENSFKVPPHTERILYRCMRACMTSICPARSTFV